jgi:putative membrane protein
VNNNRIKTFGLGVLGEDDSSRIIQQYLESDEWVDVQKKVNPATHLIDYQAKEFSALRRENLLDDFRHMEMQNILSKFYDHQGKCERIKNYPLPRQYAASSFLFVAVFILLLPFGMLEQFEAMGKGLIWLTIPFVTIVGWVFIMMELIGDYSENPFEGLGNDIPMKSLCRIIEIDLLEMLGEENIPEKIQAVNKTLM